MHSRCIFRKKPEGWNKNILTQNLNPHCTRVRQSVGCSLFVIAFLEL